MTRTVSCRTRMSRCRTRIGHGARPRPSWRSVPSDEALMDHLLPPAARHRPRARMALVTVLHSSGGTGLAHDLVRAWAPVVPAAAMSTMLVASGVGIAETLAQIGRRLGEAGLDASSLVLAGIGGGEETALQLPPPALGQRIRWPGLRRPGTLRAYGPRRGCAPAGCGRG